MTKIVGIVNVTPDSFAEATPSDRPEQAIALAERLLTEGADVIDVGAESTRPDATELSPEAEWARLSACLPEIVRLAAQRNVAVSVDTRHAATAARAIECGVGWINDVSGIEPNMAAAIASSGCRVTLMHAVTVPVVRGRTLPKSTDPIAHLRRFFRDGLDRLTAAGIHPSRVTLDPGLGFGTTGAHAVSIVSRIRELQDLGPLYVGHSRKSFQTLFTEAPAPQRDDVTLALSGTLMIAGVDYVRVHNVARHVALRAALATQLRTEPAADAKEAARG